MKTDELIDQLGRNVTVARPLPAPRIRTALWTVWAVGYLVVVAMMMFAVMSSAGVTPTPLYLVQQGVALVTGILAARAALALIIGYSAFISEVFRAGIESIERGQSEAAFSLGMSRWQTMRYVILPQAIRRVLPPLGNDFIAMLKDSALVSALGVQDITRLGNSYAASTFRYFETYNVVAFLYLVMTVGLALLVRWIERRVPQR